MQHRIFIVLGIYKPLVVGDAGYFIVAVNISATASDNKYIKINGDTEPVMFGFTTAPNVTNNQSNLAGKANHTGCRYYFKHCNNACGQYSKRQQQQYYLCCKNESAYRTCNSK